MAHKNHALDAQIAEAAMAEFLAHGYEKASLRKIAASANVTIGAIYTRYRTKDSLFCSLVQPLLDRIEETFQNVHSHYSQIPPEQFSSYFAHALQAESDAILRLLFDHYDRAVLLLCRSAGSSLEVFYDTIIRRKIDESISFFHTINRAALDPSLMKLLITAQFHMYFQIINEGYDLEAAKKTMHAVMIYHTGGWLSLLGISGVQNKTGGQV